MGGSDVVMKYTVADTLKFQVKLLSLFYLITIIYSIFIRKNNLMTISLIYIIISIISIVYLSNTYKLVLGSDSMTFYKLIGQNVEINYNQIDMLSFNIPNKMSQKVLIVSIDGKKSICRIAVFDYDDIYAKLRGISDLKNIVIE